MYENILSRVYGTPHVIRPEKLEAIRQVVTDRSAGIRADSATLDAMRADNTNRRQASVQGSVAVLPILGTLMQRIGMMEESSGGCSTQAIGKEFDRLMADPAVGAILLDVCSPGGETFGVQELADKIHAARGVKLVEASVNAEMASGALWIGTAADKVNITPSGWAGSMGVYMCHTDVSAAYEQMGSKVTYISAGEYKVEGNSTEPLSDETKAFLQSQVDVVYSQFVAAMARNRRTTQAKAKADFGKGRMLFADAAVAAGLVDRVETFDETLSRMAGMRRVKNSMRVEREWMEIERLR